MSGTPVWLTRHRNLLTALALALAAWCLYLPSMNYDFVYFDDVRILRDHPELYGQKRLSDNLRSIFVTSFPREEPLLIRDVTWLIDSRLFGFGNALGYHFGNVLLHGVVIALLFAFLIGTTQRYPFSLAVVVGWLILAVHAEPVAWIMGRKDILSGMCMLIALCAQTYRLTANKFSTRCVWFAVTCVASICGLLSKINVLAFPAVLFLHAVFFPYLRGELNPKATFSRWRLSLREGLLFSPLFAASAIVFLWYQGTLAKMGIFDRDYTAHGLEHLWNLLLIDPMVFWVYLRQLVLPHNLTVLYTWPALETNYPLWQIVAALATVLGIVTAAVWLFLRRKDLFFFLTAFFVLMVPYMNLIYIGIWVAERYLYFSSFFLLAIAVSLAESALRKQQQALKIGLLTTGIVFVSLNLFQKLSYLREWRDGESLWQYHITLPHSSPVAYQNLAAYYYARARTFQEAEKRQIQLQKMEVVLKAGLEQFWRDRSQFPPRATYYLFFLQSIVQQKNGELEAALSSLLTADQLRPGFDAINLNLARLYRALADTTTVRHQEYSEAAVNRFKKYIDLAFRNCPAPPDITRELADMEAAASERTEK